MPTEREAVERERKAWDEAAYRLSCCGAGSQESNRLRDNLYPLPKTTRPRVVRDPEDWECHEPMWWFVRGGKILAFYTKDEAGVRSHLASERYGAELSAHPTPARVALWASLLAEPNETVEEEG